MKNMEQDDIKILIADTLYKNNLIDGEVYEKCSKPHISSLPHDLRTNDTDKLQQRKDAILNNLNRLSDEIDSKYPADFFEKSMVPDEEVYNPETDEYNNYDGQKVVDYYDNLLNSSNSLNDAIREHYDNQIDMLSKAVEDSKSIIKNRSNEVDNLQVTKDDLEKEISNDTKQVRIENRKFEELQLEFNKQDDLAKQIEAHAEVLTNVAKQNNLNYDDMVYSTSDSELERISPGLSNYIKETVKIQEEFFKGRHPEKIQEDLRSQRYLIDDLNKNIEGNRRQIVTQDELIRKNQIEINWYNNEITKYNSRIKYLKSNKPNKNQNDGNYQELVDKKNLAISFKNDIRKAQDFQNELRKVNESLGFEDVEIWDGLEPDGSGGYIGF